MDYEITNYTDFCLYYNTHEEEFEIVLDYDDFQVFLHHESGCYFYLEKSDGDADEFYELELCATLQHDVCHELLIDPAETGEVMSALFDCDCCGEYVTDDYIEYLWFKRVE